MTAEAKSISDYCVGLAPDPMKALGDYLEIGNSSSYFRAIGQFNGLMSLAFEWRRTCVCVQGDWLSPADLVHEVRIYISSRPNPAARSSILNIGGNYVSDVGGTQTQWLCAGPIGSGKSDLQQQLHLNAWSYDQSKVQSIDQEFTIVPHYYRYGHVYEIVVRRTGVQGEADNKKIRLACIYC